MKVSFDVRVRKVEKVTRSKEDEESEFYRLYCRDEEGLTTIVIITPKRFDGIRPGDTIQVLLKNPQKTL